MEDNKLILYFKKFSQMDFTYIIFKSKFFSEQNILRKFDFIVLCLSKVSLMKVDWSLIGKNAMKVGEVFRDLLKNDNYLMKH